MKQFILLIALLSAALVSSAQDNNLKLSTESFAKTYSQTPIVINVREARKSPIFKLEKMPSVIWKHHPETVSYYNNHPANSFCFNQSQGWQMIQVRPIKNQIVYEAAAIGGGIILGTILEALSQL